MLAALIAAQPNVPLMSPLRGWACEELVVGGELTDAQRKDVGFARIILVELGVAILQPRGK